jgi:hypothetical protein
MNDDINLKNEKNFYFQGKWFDTSEELFDYSRRWNDFHLNQETAERLLDRLKKDIVLNVFLHGKSFTNSEFSEYLNRIFNFSILEMDKNNADV